MVQDYVDARSESDHAQICELYSEDFKRELGVGSNCEAFVREQSGGEEGGAAAEELEIVDVRVRDPDRATAEIDVIREGEGPARIGLILTREDGDFRISGLQ